MLSTFRSNRSSAAASTLSTSGAMGLSEKTFLNPKKMTASKEIRDEKGPSLDDFDKEIEIYQVCSLPSVEESLPVKDSAKYFSCFFMFALSPRDQIVKVYLPF